MRALLAAAALTAAVAISPPPAAASSAPTMRTMRMIVTVAIASDYQIQGPTSPVTCTSRPWAIYCRGHYLDNHWHCRASYKIDPAKLPGLPTPRRSCVAPSSLDDLIPVPDPGPGAGEGWD